MAGKDICNSANNDSCALNNSKQTEMITNIFDSACDYSVMPVTSTTIGKDRICINAKAAVSDYENNDA